jgi:hypothetical protein
VSAESPIVDLMAALRRSVEEAAAKRGKDRKPFVQPVLDREARQELDAEDRADYRRSATLRTLL